MDDKGLAKCPVRKRTNIAKHLLCGRALPVDTNVIPNLQKKKLRHRGTRLKVTPPIKVSSGLGHQLCDSGHKMRSHSSWNVVALKPLHSRCLPVFCFTHFFSSLLLSSVGLEKKPTKRHLACFATIQFLLAPPSPGLSMHSAQKPTTIDFTVTWKSPPSIPGLWAELHKNSLTGRTFPL